MTLKVSLFMHDFSGGGVERMRLNLAAELVLAGCEVSIVVVNALGPLAAHLPEGVKGIDLSSSRLLTALPKLRRFLLNHKPDVLVSSLDHNNIAALCVFATIRTGTKLVICQHNALSQEVRQLGWKYRAVPLLYRLLAHKADAIVAVSKGVADDLTATAGIARTAVTVISNPVIQSSRLREFTVPAHPWMDDRSVPVFVFVGRLVPQKNPMMLIAAFVNHLTQRRARLVVLGDGPLRSTMVQALRDAGAFEHVYFAGYVAEPICWIAHAEALLLTSDYEGFGNVIVEALACGTPVIATNCPHGPAEILEDGRYGRLVGVGDASAFAAAMATDLRHHFPSAMLRARACNFTAEKAAADHVALFSRWNSSSQRPAFGLMFTSKNAAEIAQHVVSVAPDATKLVVTPNIDHVRLLHSNARFQAACSSAELVCADGWPVAVYAALRGAAPRRRATGCDIMRALLSHSDIGSRRIFAVVESPQTAAALSRWLILRRWDNWIIEAAPHDLGRNPVAQERLSTSISAFNTEILIMTLGAPTSETFVHQNAHNLPCCWALCVGQALRVEAGLTRRAPGSWRRIGLEWAWRCLNEPLRLSPRCLRALLWFPYAMATDILLPLIGGSKIVRSE